MSGLKFRKHIKVWLFSVSGAALVNRVCLSDAGIEILEKLETLEKMITKRIYLATPYSHDSETVRADRAKFATQVAGRLMSAGLIVFSPNTHGHAIAVECGLPGDYDYWRESSMAFVAWCTDLYVICVPGWRESTGVSAEILLADKLGKNIVYLRPGNYFFDGVFKGAC